MLARWHEALDGQAAAFAWFDSARGRAYARGWAESWGEGGVHVHGVTQKAISSLGIRAYREMLDVLPETLLGADTLYVEPDMMTVFEKAAETFEPEPLLETDLPCANGFLWLPRPLVLKDRHGVEVSTRAFAWRSIVWEQGPEAIRDGVKAGLALFMLHRHGDTDGYTPTDKANAVNLSPETMLITHVFPWPFGQAYPTKEEIDLPGTLRDVAKPLLALWRLMQQPVTVNTRERPPRAVRRRMPDPMTENLITVVRLRRPHRDTDPDHEPGHVEWSHRWLVGGHWRQQPYPSLGITRQIWISPYVKGPDDKPLVVRKARVFDFAR